MIGDGADRCIHCRSAWTFSLKTAHRLGSFSLICTRNDRSPNLTRPYVCEWNPGLESSSSRWALRLPSVTRGATGP